MGWNLQPKLAYRGIQTQHIQPPTQPTLPYISNTNPSFQHTIQPICSIQPNPGDGSDGVNIDEFVQGCYRLSGEATTLHTQVGWDAGVSQLWSPMVLGWIWIWIVGVEKYP